MIEKNLQLMHWSPHSIDYSHYLTLKCSQKNMYENFQPIMIQDNFAILQRFKEKFCSILGKLYKRGRKITKKKKRKKLLQNALYDLWVNRRSTTLHAGWRAEFSKLFQVFVQKEGIVATPELEEEIWQSIQHEVEIVGGEDYENSSHFTRNENTDRDIFSIELQEIKCDDACNERSDGPTYMEIDDVERFGKMNFDPSGTIFKSFCEGTAPLVWEEIRFGHRPLTENVMSVIVKAIDCSNGVDELELRDCAPTEKLLQLLCVAGRKNEITEFSITGEDDISRLIQSICTILKSSVGKSLVLSENNLKDETIAHLEDCLTHIPVPSLSSLDVSNNEEISNYKILAGVLNTSSMTELRLLNCNIVTEQLKELGCGLQEKLTKLNLSFNTEMGRESFTCIGDLLQENAEFLGLSECDVTETEAEALFHSLRQHRVKLNALDLSYNSYLRYSGVSVVSRYASTCQLTEISLAGCNLDSYCIAILKRNLSGHKLTKLDVSDNSPMQDESVKTLGQMAADCPIENLDLSNCTLSSDQICEFSVNLGNFKITKLDISDGQMTLDESMIEAIKAVAVKVEEELTVCYENTEEYIPLLKNAAKNVRIVYGYCNYQRDIDHVTLSPKIKRKKKFID